MADNLESWKQEGRYLPEFMRDFHDQKELFKFLDEVRGRSDAKEGSSRSLEAVTWSVAHIYTVDIFLWVIASHGYTLQRSRKPFNFANIVDTVSAATARHREQSMKALRSIFSAIAFVLTLTASQAQASDLHVEPNTILCHTLAAVSDPHHPGCWRAAGPRRVEIIAALSTATQLRLWSSDGSESLTAWAARADADRMQRSGQ